MQAEKRIFAAEGAWKGGMNKDVHHRYLQNGFYRDARNVNFMVNGDKFILTNVKGNTEISYTFNDGDSIVVGSFDDKNNRRVFILVWNSLGDHEVVQVSYDGVPAATQLTEGAGLGFVFNNLITGIEVVNSRFLFWVDDSTEPVCIDLENAPTSVTAATRYLIEAAKAPDPTPATVRYGTDVTRNSNNLTNKIYRFRTRYITRGGFRTHCSTISKVAVPEFDYMAYTSADKPYYDNTLYVSLPLVGNSHIDVEKIEVLIQSGNSDDAMGDWYKLTEIEPSQNPLQPYDIVQTVTYTGSEPLTAVDNVEVNQAYSFVPPTAKDVILLPSNVVSYYNITDNLDASSVTPKVVVEQVNIAKPTSTAAATTTLTWTNSNTATTGTFTNQQYGIEIVDPTYDLLQVTDTPKVGDNLRIKMTLQYSGTGDFSGNPTKDIEFNYIVKEDDIFGVSAADARGLANVKLLEYLNSIDTRYDGYGGVIFNWFPNPFGSVASILVYQGDNELDPQFDVTTTVTAVQIYDQSSAAFEDADGTHEGNSNYPNPSFPYDQFRTFKSFKKNALHKFAISYEDEKGRRTPAIPLTSIFVEDDFDLTYTSLKMYIDHLAPEGSVRYHILYAGNDTYDEYVQLWTNLEDEKVSRVSNRTWSSDINTIIAGYVEDIPNSPLEYNFVKGDKIRLLAMYDTSATSIIYLDNTLVYEVISDDTAKVYFNGDIQTDVNNASGVTFDAASDNVLVEVYRPKVNVEDIAYYEIGVTGTVDSDRYHIAPKYQIDVDQTASVPAEINLINSGDTYYKFRVTALAAPSKDEFVEDANISDFMPSKCTDRGRLSVVDELALKAVRRPTAVVYSQPFVNNTDINGLSMVLGTSIKEYDIKYGSIQKVFLRQDREVIVLFENKVGNFGVLSELVKQSTGDLQYATDAILNNLNVYAYEGGVGTNPESAVLVQNTIYFQSPQNNAVCRITPQTPVIEISNYGMKSWFNDNLDSKSNYLGDSKFIGGYDIRNGCYILSLYGYVEASSVTGTTGMNVATFVKQDAFGSQLDIESKAEMLVLKSSDDYYTTRDFLIAKVDDDTASIAYVGDGIPQGDVFSNAWLRYRIGTLWFNEEANSWMSFLDILPEDIQTCGIDYLSFYDGSIWLSDTGTRGSFMGTDNPAETTLVFNQEPSKVKIPYNLEQETNSVWSSETDGDVEVDEGTQTSQIFETFYSQYQPNEWSSAFRYDTTTPNVTYPLQQGRFLRGRTFKIRLSNDSTTEVKLESVTVLSEASEASL